MPDEREVDTPRSDPRNVVPAGASVPSARRRRQTSNLSRSGSITSNTTTWGRKSLATRSATRPSSAG